MGTADMFGKKIRFCVFDRRNDNLGLIERMRCGWVWRAESGVDGFEGEELEGSVFFILKCCSV